uniref:S41 family peptidase n=1 Tax=Roseihalotalea indica TaxID=2867963 RepID=A0AA49JEF2_9BACT|nr:S41 family peptidase [Tunicatimonas sp. TK19036]
MIRFILFIVTGVCFSGISVLAQTPQALEHLKTFTRLYGYVRYFHPSNEAIEVDWEQLAIYGAQQVRQAPDQEALQDTLRALFGPIAPTLIIYPSAESAEFIRDPLIPTDTNSYRTVAWQHLGVRFGEQSNIYQSKRTGQPVKQTSPSYGTMGNSMEVIQYRGNDVKFVASIKMAAGAEGSGQLWLREERGAQRGFALNMDDRPITDTAWQTYEITATLAPDATSLGFGCSLQGAGKLWVDDFQLYTKNPHHDTWKPVPLANADFEEDDPTRPPKNWFARSREYTFEVTDSLSAQGSQSVQIFTENLSQNDLLFSEYSKVGDVYQHEIGSGLSCIVPLALYGNEEHTFPPVNENTFNTFIRTLADNVPVRLTGDDLDVRLGGIIMSWNVFQHFYPYFDVISVDWEQALTDAFQEAYQDSSATDFLHTLRVLTAKLEDGHGRVYLGGSHTETHFPPVLWEWVEDELIITMSDQEELQVGDIITHIQGQSPEAYFAPLYETISAATSGWRNFRAKEVSLAGPFNSNLSLQIQTVTGSTHQVDLKRDVPAHNFYSDYLMKSTHDSTVQELESGIYYVNIDRVSMGEIRERMEVLQQAKSIIFDLRGYPNSNHEIISHLLTTPDTSTAWMQVPHVIYPDQQHREKYEQYGWQMQLKEPNLDAKIIFIIDGRAISYAESFMGFIEHYNLATIVGQPTAGTNGNVNSFSLPGGYYVYWTGMKVLKHDDSQHHGVGILPDVYVEKTIAGVRAGRDEFLEKAMELARSE